ncbi:MAG: prepilin peptidase [Anaerovoracaceae bacterium]
MNELYFAYAVIYGFVFLFGIIIGSFLNVLIYRMPLGINIAKGRSFCPNCDTQLSNRDLIPIVSFLFLKGKCRTCGNKISGRYPLVELLGGILAVLSVAAYGLTWQSGVVFVVSAILLTITFIDIDTMEIPNTLVLAILVIAIASVFVKGEVLIIQRLLGMVIISLPMFLMNFIIKDSFGGGDIKLCFACGFLLGWQNMLVGTFIAVLLGGIYGIYVLATKQKGKKDHFAFGPFLGLGMIIALLWGSEIFTSYLTTFGL